MVSQQELDRQRRAALRQVQEKVSHIHVPPNLNKATHNSPCFGFECEGTHTIRYCPVAGFVPGKSKGTVEGLKVALAAKREAEQRSNPPKVETPASSAGSSTTEV